MSTLQEKEILVIEDAEDVRLLARKILENDGAIVQTASSISEGIALAEKSAPHLIFLDLKFPEKSGFDFLAYRKSSLILAKVPIIVFSGLRDKKSVLMAINLEISDYLIKPFRTTQLLQKTRKTLKISSFKSYTFSGDPIKKVQISAPVDIKNVSEVGLSIESSVKLSINEVVEIKSATLEKIGAENVVLKAGTRPVQYVGGSRYVSQVLFTGVGEEFVKSVRRIIGG